MALGGIGWYWVAWGGVGTALGGGEWYQARVGSSERTLALAQGPPARSFPRRGMGGVGWRGVAVCGVGWRFTSRRVLPQRVHTPPPAQIFFGCLKQDKSPLSNWYNEVKGKIGKRIFQREMIAGNEIDHSAESLYLDDVRAMSAAFAKADTREASEKRLNLLTNWRSAGRSSESGFMAYSAFRYDSKFSTPLANIKQSKTTKTKTILFVSAPDRNADWMLAFGDFRVYERGRNQVIEGENCWINPSMQGATSGQKLTDAIKGLQPPGRPGALKKYEDICVESLPPHPTAAGIRPGACDTLITNMPAEIAAFVTGHDLTAVGALFEYTGCKRAHCMPGAIVLAAWRAFPWGQLGVGPTPPSLAPIIAIGVSEQLLEGYCDALLYIDEHQPVPLRRHGNLRGLVMSLRPQCGHHDHVLLRALQSE